MKIRLKAMFGVLSVGWTAGCGEPPAANAPSAPPPPATTSAADSPASVVAGPVLDDKEMAEETAWWSSLGVKVPPQGVLLKAPFDSPLSRRSFVVPTAWYRQPSRETVSPGDLARDLVHLEVAFKHVYGGYEQAEARGLRFSDWFARWRAMLASKGSAPIPTAEAFAPVAELMSVQLDNHTGPMIPTGFGSGSASYLLAEKPAGPCTRARTVAGTEFELRPTDPAQQPKAVLVPDGKRLRPGFYVTSPASRGELDAVLCGEKWVRMVKGASDSYRDPSKLMEASISHAGDAPAYEKLSADVGYLRLPTFSKQNGEKLLALAKSLPQSAGKERALIVDLRFNDGGDGATAYPVLERWVDEVRLGTVKGKRIEKNSCLVEALGWGYTQITMRSMKPPISEELRTDVQRQLDGLFAAPEEGCPVTVQQSEGSWRYPDRRFRPGKGRTVLMVLVNELCGSDCELITMVLAAQPEALVLGVNTCGVMQFVQPSYTVLPYSRIRFRIARGMSDAYGDGRSIDGYGFDVDVFLGTQAAQSNEALLELAALLTKEPRP
jgi:hypothetical protein